MITQSGDWSIGSEAADIAAYLVDVQGDDPVQEHRWSYCRCGGEIFLLDFSEDHQCAKFTCTSCGGIHLIADSEECWEDAREDASIARFDCGNCEEESVNIGVSYSLYQDAEVGVKWLCVGTRCVAGGALDYATFMKIAYQPSMHMLDRA
ncbi:MAG: hypothetical protein AAF526_03120 [Pseudomonadota bacterium]